MVQLNTYHTCLDRDRVTRVTVTYGVIGESEGLVLRPSVGTKMRGREMGRSEGQLVVQDN